MCDIVEVDITEFKVYINNNIRLSHRLPPAPRFVLGEPYKKEEDLKDSRNEYLDFDIYRYNIEVLINLSGGLFNLR